MYEPAEAGAINVPIDKLHDIIALHFTRTLAAR
jgi:hypothetical protein|uniref:Uncharacterized protein n=1 Tax=Peduovirinae sp. ctGB41 TaxID=2825070 RepID=A0A8S5QCR3_9CAUD|nr:MAG TPA: hypothetical protein [Peduovirinae sp. ctGB41]